MGKMCGNEVSQTTISRFESLNYPINVLLRWKELAAKWLEVADSSINSNGGMNCNALSSADRKGRLRKKRTAFKTTEINILQKAFAKNPMPTSEEIDDVADTLNKESAVVRVWFSNRSGLLYFPSIT